MSATNYIVQSLDNIDPITFQCPAFWEMTEDQRREVELEFFEGADGRGNTDRDVNDWFDAELFSAMVLARRRQLRLVSSKCPVQPDEEALGREVELLAATVQRGRETARGFITEGSMPPYLLNRHMICRRVQFRDLPVRDPAAICYLSGMARTVPKVVALRAGGKDAARRKSGTPETLSLGDAALLCSIVERLHGRESWIQCCLQHSDDIRRCCEDDAFLEALTTAVSTSVELLDGRPEDSGFLRRAASDAGARGTVLRRLAAIWPTYSVDWYLTAKVLLIWRKRALDRDANF